MNKKFILILFVIFIIGFITYKYKKNELFYVEPIRLIPNISTPSVFFTGGPYGNLKLLYQNVDSIVSEPKKIFQSSDFNDNYALMVAKFLNSREKIDNWINTTVLPNFRPYLYFFIYKKYTFTLSGTPIYFECSLDKPEKQSLPMLKIIFNKNPLKDDPNNSLRIEHNIESSFNNSYNIGDLNKIEIYINTIKSLYSDNSYVIENFYNIRINGNLFSSIKLKNGLSDHFLNNLKNVSHYSSEENIKTTMVSELNFNLYGSYVPPVIESKRTSIKDGTTGFQDILSKCCGRGWFSSGMGELNIKRPIIGDGYYALGDYYNRPDLVDNIWSYGWTATRGTEDALLVKKKDNVVIPVETITKRWYNGGCRYCDGNAIILFSNNNLKKTVPVITGLTTTENREMNFLALGDYAEPQTVPPRQAPTRTNALPDHPHVLIREDYLESINNYLGAIYDDRGSGVSEQLRVWTYFGKAYDQRMGNPGKMLALFITGYGDDGAVKQYPNGIRSHIIKESALVSQKMMDLSQNERKTIDGFFNLSSGFMNVTKPIEENFENLNSYYNKIKGNKASDSVSNPLESIYTSNSQRRNKQSSENAKKSEDNYTSTTNYNLKMNQLQTENNNFYNFMDGVTKQLREQRARERDMVSTELDSLKSGVTAKNGLQSTINEANKTSLAVDSSLNILGSNMVEQVRQYSVQKDNENMLSSFNPQVLI